MEYITIEERKKAIDSSLEIMKFMRVYKKQIEEVGFDSQWVDDMHEKFRVASIQGLSQLHKKPTPTNP